MSKRELSRRSFAESLLISAAAIVWPGYTWANHRRAVDLVITAIRWSEDFGVTWHTDPVESEAGDFESEAEVIGLGGARPNRISLVEFGFNAKGVLVSESDISGSGLGGEVHLSPNTSPNGDDY